MSFAYILDLKQDPQTEKTITTRYHGTGGSQGCLKLALQVFALLSHTAGDSPPSAPLGSWLCLDPWRCPALGLCAERPQGLFLSRTVQAGKGQDNLQQPSFLQSHHHLHRILSPGSRKLGVGAEHWYGVLHTWL